MNRLDHDLGMQLFAESIEEGQLLIFKKFGFAISQDYFSSPPFTPDESIGNSSEIVSSYNRLAHALCVNFG
ncbi:MAG: hypothetical protein AB8B87_27510 [Granulosicoccus sp.]